MMNAVNPYLQQYKKNQVETANSEQLLIMLYDAAIQFLNKAKIAIDAGDVGVCTNHLYSAQKIILEFMNTLDMEKGGELAERLYGLYGYFYRTLVKVNLSHDMDKIDEIIRFLSNLRDTWQQAIAIAQAERASEAPGLMDDHHSEFEHNDTSDDEDEEDDDENEEDEEDDDD